MQVGGPLCRRSRTRPGNIVVRKPKELTCCLACSRNALDEVSFSALRDLPAPMLRDSNLLITPQIVQKRSNATRETRKKLQVASQSRIDILAYAGWRTGTVPTCEQCEVDMYRPGFRAPRVALHEEATADTAITPLWVLAVDDAAQMFISAYMY
jgi:hypothetical protein